VKPVSGERAARHTAGANDKTGPPFRRLFGRDGREVSADSKAAALALNGAAGLPGHHVLMYRALDNPVRTADTFTSS
jgi:hypothetical protein